MLAADLFIDTTSFLVSPTNNVTKSYEPLTKTRPTFRLKT